MQINHVLGSQTTFQVRVKSNDAGPGDGIFDKATPEHNVHRIQLSFFKPSVEQNPNAVNQSQIGQPLNSIFDSGFGGVNGLNWTTSVTSGEFAFVDPTGEFGLFNIAMDGSNEFVGEFTLGRPGLTLDDVRLARIELLNGETGEQYANFSRDEPSVPGLTPEGDSAAMLLPALLPLGLVLRRRMAVRGAKSATPTVA